MNLITIGRFNSGTIFYEHGWFFAIPEEIQASSE